MTTVDGRARWAREGGVRVALAIPVICLAVVAILYVVQTPLVDRAPASERSAATSRDLDTSPMSSPAPMLGRPAERTESRDSVEVLASTDSEGLGSDSVLEEHTWEEVADQVRQQVLLTPEEKRMWIEAKYGWPMNPDAELQWIDHRYGGGRGLLTDVDLAAIREVAYAYNTEILDLTSRSVEEMAKEIEYLWNSGQFRKAQGVVQSAEDESEQDGYVMFTATGTAGGWSAAVPVRSTQNRYLTELRDKARQLRRERDLAILERLKEIGKPGKLDRNSPGPG